MSRSQPLCLVVDDEPDILELLVLTLTPMNIDCITASCVTEARNHLKKNDFDLCLTDMKLPDGDGIELVKHIQQHYPTTPVAVITAYGSVESAVHALKVGAFDYVSKPVQLTELRNLVNTALRLTEKRDNTLSKLVGCSLAIEKLRAKIEKLARSQAPVYIQGESGTGKEVVARLIHSLSARTDKAFVPVNCGAIPTELMESEFFGHKKGSFTGANADKVGLFKSAQGGTLFLDEVADLPQHMQVKLLRAIQEKQIRPVGATKEEAVDVRILSATHQNLAELVNQGVFRQDLFYRINVISLHVPPLRERLEDVPLLVDTFLERLSQSLSLPEAPRLSEIAQQELQQYSFPGNVRELENILERAIALCEDDVIQPEDLQLPDNPTFEVANTDMSPTNTPSERDMTSLDPYIDDIEKEKILAALEQTNGNKTKAAKVLGISFGALRYRLQKFKIG